MKTILKKIYHEDGTGQELKDMWKNLVRNHAKDVLQRNMINVALEEEAHFPYVEVDEDAAVDDFARLVELTPKDVVKNGSWKEIGSFPSQGMKPIKKYFIPNVAGMKTSKRFNWRFRAHVASKSGISLASTWSEKGLNNVVEKFWTFAQVPYPSRSLWRKILSWRVAIPSQFRPAIAKTIYDMFGKKGDILDMSAGWGDRLTGAFAAGVKSYTGVDPSPVQHKIYQSVLKFMEKHYPNQFRHTKVNLIKSGSENVKLPHSKFDLSFTSPPYFDTELYVGGKQSHKITSYEMWKEKFYFPTFDNTFSAVKQKGHIIVNVKNYERAPLVTDLIEYSKSKKLKFLGTMGMVSDKMMGNLNNGKECEPVMIWEKL